MSMPLRSPATSATHSPLGICDLLAPLGLEEFIGKHYGKSVFVEHRHDRDYYGGFVTLADLDSCLLAAAASPKTILQLVPPPGSSRSALPVQASAISKDRIYDAYLSGDTVRLIGVEHYWAPVASLAASMHDAFAATIGINIFLTPPRSQAFPLHFDLVDTFLIQVAGAKRWQIWEPTYEQPMETRLSQHHLPNVTVLDESKLKLCEDSLLEAGDILYMPRGFYHKGTTEDELSLHVTATVKQVYWLDLLQRAFEVAALDHVNLREALPPGFLGDPQVRQSLSQHFAGMLQSFCELASFDQGFDSFVEEEIRSQPFPPDGHFAVLPELEQLSAGSVVERRRGLACWVDFSPETASIHFGPNQVRGPLSLALALQFVRDHPRFRVSEVPGALSLDSKVVLIRRLVREGLLRPVPSA
ncbi:MAG TPA: cupin domain-containing protein [Thermoanaerobaculia bacterium]|nr:cupin domain-containing protein [Thermoanaerobaculia bacterium]